MNFITKYLAWREYLPRDFTSVLTHRITPNYSEKLQKNCEQLFIVLIANNFFLSSKDRFKICWYPEKCEDASSEEPKAILKFLSSWKQLAVEWLVLRTSLSSIHTTSALVVVMLICFICLRSEYFLYLMAFLNNNF